MHVTKRLDMPLLMQELTAANVEVLGLNYTGTDTDGTLLAGDALGMLIEVPPDAVPVVDAHVAPPRVIDVAQTISVEARLRTTDGTPHEILRFSCLQKSLYQGDLTISGIDAGNFVSKIMEGRFTWKRTTVVNAVMVGIVVVSDIHDAAAASWVPNALPQGSDIVFTVQGAAGRTIDWLLVGEVGRFAPAGLTS